MKIKGNISIFINRESTTIEIRDSDASVTFVQVKLTPEDLSAALSRQAYVPVEMEVVGLEKVGKKMEHKTFEFEIPDGISEYRGSSEPLKKVAQQLCPEGWISDGHFGSQNSFFQKDGKRWARVIIRRWI